MENKERKEGQEKIKKDRRKGRENIT